MQQLLALATLASCKKDPTKWTDPGYGVVDPMPEPALDAGIAPPPVVDAGTVTATDAGAPVVDASKREGGHAVIVPLQIEHTTTPPPTVTAYGVVDPLPPPTVYKK
jgi:hypothetical protein